MLSLAVVAGLLAAEPQAPTPLSKEEQAQIILALKRGQLLYQYDQSAWHITDAAFAALPGDIKQFLRGYITVPDGSQIRTTFYGGEPGSRYRIYTAVWDGKEAVAVETFSPDAKVPLTAKEESFVEVRDVAVHAAAKLSRCSDKPFNATVLPAESADGPAEVYLLTPQTDLNMAPFGGHYRFEVKGGEVVSQRSFAKTCIALPTATNASVGKASEKPVGVFITHLLDSVPTEIHVFGVYATKLPIYVSVKSGSLFVVEVSGGEPRVRKIK